MWHLFQKVTNGAAAPHVVSFDDKAQAAFWNGTNPIQDLLCRSIQFRSHGRSTAVARLKYRFPVGVGHLAHGYAIRDGTTAAQ